MKTAVVYVDGPPHKRQRHLMAPSFHKDYIFAYQAGLVDLVVEYLKGWKVGAEIDVFREMQILTLRSAVQSFFALELKDEAAELGRMLKEWLTLITRASVLLFPFNVPGTPLHKLEDLSARLEAEMRRLIRRRKADGTDRKDILGMLIKTSNADGSKLSDDELVANVMLMIIAGHETATNALTWTLFLLAQHPTILSAVNDEVRDVLGTEPPTPTSLRQLSLVERVVKESMRLLPPVVYGFRRVVRDTMLGGYDLRVGTRIVWSQYVTHHLPDVFPDPERFDPDRWLGSPPPAHTYIPFGAGPHACLGAAFAMMEICTVLSLILQRFSVQAVQDSRIDRVVQFTLSPKGGLPLRLLPAYAHVDKVRVRGNIHEMVKL